MRLYSWDLTIVLDANFLNFYGDNLHLGYPVQNPAEKNPCKQGLACIKAISITLFQFQAILAEVWHVIIVAGILSTFPSLTRDNSWSQPVAVNMSMEKKG